MTDAPTPHHGNALSLVIVERILRLDAEGLTYLVIAERLGIHINTIEHYLRAAGRPYRQQWKAEKVERLGAWKRPNVKSRKVDE